MNFSRPSALRLVCQRLGENRHWQMLFMACGVMVAALLLEVLPEERVAVRGLSKYPLPHLCMSRLLYGASCPGCGLTRSFIHLAHGEWRSAWSTHRCGWLLAALVAAQIPYRALVLTRLLRPLNARASQCLAFAVVAALLGNWLWCAPWLASIQR